MLYNSLKLLPFKLNVNFHMNSHLIFYGAFGGVLYEYIVNQEKFFKNTIFGTVYNHFIFGGLFFGLTNLKFAYKGAAMCAYLGSGLAAARYVKF